MKLRITVEGKTYEVDVDILDERGSPVPVPAAASLVSSPLPELQMVSPAPFDPGPGAAVDEKVCRSPIAGVVTSILTKVGDEVKENDTLLVVEAMKMETRIASPVSGKVKAIHVWPADGVKVGQVLVEFE